MIVGLTGGIGTGKTTVANMFNKLGVPIFVSDIEAKIIMQNNPIVIKKIKALLGDEAYLNNELNKPYIANIVFKDKQKLNDLNAIVHPAVAEAFSIWYAKQVHPYVIKESAILFESNGHAQCHYVITVTAPVDVRINRVVARDNSTKSQVEDRIKNQASEDFKIKNSDYVINNQELDKTSAQVLKINIDLLNKS